MNITTRDLVTGAPMVLRCPDDYLPDWLAMADTEVCRDPDRRRALRNTGVLQRLRDAAGETHG